MYELVNAGEIDVLHIGRSARVPVAAVEEFVERRLDGWVRAGCVRGVARGAPGGWCG